MPMDMSPGFVQKMMLTPRMLLSMHVLQLNIMDLRVFISAELEENPLLEEETQGVSCDESEGKLDDELSILVDEYPSSQNLPEMTSDDSRGISNEKRGYFESLITKGESLYEHLAWQLQVMAKNDEEKRIGEFIIGNLDKNGFLTMDFEQMRQALKVDINGFKRALALVRSFDPVGIGARNLKESLLIQLDASGKADTHVYRIVYSYLEDLEEGHYEKIAHALSISLEEVAMAKKRISYLNPKPGGACAGQESGASIEADVFMNRDNGTYSIELNERDLPGLRINSYYRTILKDKHVSPNTRDYIKKKLSGAAWLTDALNQRRKTIRSVCEYLVEIQKDFLDNGDSDIKPLTLSQVAGPLSISEATVSRVVSNKYAQISNRMLALKAFFAGHLKTADDTFVSDRAVKQKIQGLIEEESAEGALSDEMITEILHKENIKISRRTVSKYRESLRILPSYLRKKFK